MTDIKLETTIRSAAFTGGEKTDKEIRFALFKPIGIELYGRKNADRSFLTKIKTNYHRIGRACINNRSEGSGDRDPGSNLQAVQMLADYEAEMINKGWKRLDHTQNIYKKALIEQFRNAVDFKTLPEGLAAAVALIEANILTTKQPVKPRKLKPK